MVKRQALSLVTFVSHALRNLAVGSGNTDSSFASKCSNIISLLLALSAPEDGKLPDDDIVKMAREAVKNALRAMPAKDFVQSILVVVQSGTAVRP